MSHKVKCPHCRGGRISVDGGSLGYDCPDCDGSGRIEVEGDSMEEIRCDDEEDKEL